MSQTDLEPPCLWRLYPCRPLAARIQQLSAQTAGKSMKEWNFSVKNPAEKDATKQTLFMFYTLNGNFIAANFTGK